MNARNPGSKNAPHLRAHARLYVPPVAPQEEIGAHPLHLPHQDQMISKIKKVIIARNLRRNKMKSSMSLI